MRRYSKTLLFIVFLLLVSCRENIVDFQTRAETGSVFLASVPRGADIYMDQSWTGKSTPDSLVGLQPGYYALKLKLLGYKDTTIFVNISRGKKATYSVTLKDY